MSNNAFFVAQLSRHLTPFIRVLETLPEEKLDYQEYRHLHEARQERIEI